MEENLVRYGVHKVFFFYTDEYYSPDKIGGNVGIYDDRETAEKDRKQLDINVLRNISVDNLAWDFWGFYDGRIKEVESQLIAYMKANGFDDKAGYEKGSGDSFYFSVSEKMSDDNIRDILNITGIYFHQVLEYKSFKASAYVKMNYDFWGKKVFDKLKSDGLLDTRKPFLGGESRKGYYLINKPPKGRKAAKFNSQDEALKMAIRVFLEYTGEFPENNFLGKTYVEEWSDQFFLVMAFLANCQSIDLTHEEVTASNLKQLTAKLKKLKSAVKLDTGMRFFNVSLPNPEQARQEEIQALIELLKVKPFEIFVAVSEVNGEEMREYYEGYSTF